ncbi:MAG: hypothetical protein WAN78_05900 [Methanoregula sp.]
MFGKKDNINMITGAGCTAARTSSTGFLGGVVLTKTSGRIMSIVICQIMSRAMPACEG